MENFFENVREKFSGAAKFAAQKSNELVGVTKIKFAISDAEEDIKKTMRDMGELLYQAYKNEDAPGEVLEEKCKAIDIKYDEIEQLRRKLGEIKNMKVCSYCGKELERDATFCSKCGERV